MSYVASVMAEVRARNPSEPEFQQAVQEVGESIEPVLERHPEYRSHRILERIVEPERVIMFRVPWTDDQGDIYVNRGFRVQMNSAIGPYKGGLRFHASVNLGILKLLALDQVFRNARTTLPLGGAMGGSDFDPKGKSDQEVMRFCQSFMNELHRHIGPGIDVPAGDIGVGGREIGYLFGQYRRLRNGFFGALSGKGLGWGGTVLRPEATGYGAVYFAAAMLGTRGESLEGKRCLVSGSGIVAQYMTEKLLESGAKVLTLSDSGGYVYDAEGITAEKLSFVMELKTVRRGRIKEYAEKYESADYTEVDLSADHNPLWSHEAHCAFAGATQNEISRADAENLLGNGVDLVCEGCNMSSSPEAAQRFVDDKILYGPGKAASLGGVVVSGLETVQNSAFNRWTRDKVDRRLQSIMTQVHRTCLEAADQFAPGDYRAGVDIASFLKVADAMIDQGVS